MLPYFVLLIIVSFLCILGALFEEMEYISFSKKKAKILLMIIMLVLIVFAGFRFEVGVDFNSYVRIFERKRWSTTNEPGFMLLVDIFGYLKAKPQFVFLALAIIMQFLVYKIISKFSVNYWLSILIYLTIAPLYLATFNGIRQFLAVALFISMINLIEKKRFIFFLICTVFGALFFHLSIVIIIPVYFILQMNFTINNKLLIIISVIIGSFFINYLIGLTFYGDYLTHVRKTPISIGTYIFFVFSMSLIIFESKLGDFKHKKLFLGINFLSFLTLLLVILQDKGIMIQMFMRLNSYFFFIYILLIPVLISQFKDQGLKVLLMFFLFVILLSYYLRTIIMKGEGYMLVPYKFNFELF